MLENKFGLFKFFPVWISLELGDLLLKILQV